MKSPEYTYMIENAIKEDKGETAFIVYLLRVYSYV